MFLGFVRHVHDRYKWYHVLNSGNIFLGSILGAGILCGVILGGSAAIPIYLIWLGLAVGALLFGISVLIIFLPKIIPKFLIAKQSNSALLKVISFFALFILTFSLATLNQSSWQEEKNLEIQKNYLLNQIIYLTDYSQKPWGRQWYGWLDGQIWELNFQSRVFNDISKWDLKPGLGIKVEGQVKPYLFEQVDNFNYQNYALSQGLQGKITIAKITGTTNCNWFCHWIQTWHKLKTEQSANLRQLMCKTNLNEIKTILTDYDCGDVVALSQGLVFGGNQNFTEQMKKNFQVTGLSHIIAISGYNVTLIILILDLALIRLRFPFQIKIGAFFIILIALVWLVGPSASVLRAVIMGLVLLLAQTAGRPCSPLRALFWSISILLIINPLYLYSVSLQLSASATFGLLIFLQSPLLQSKPLNLILESFWGTLTANLFTFPVLINTFGYFSPLSFLPNMLILPLVPILMWLNILNLIPFLGQFTSWITAISQSLILSLVSWVSNYLPVWYLQKLNPLEIASWYIFLIGLSLIFKILIRLKINNESTSSIT